MSAGFLIRHWFAGGHQIGPFHFDIVDVSNLTEGLAAGQMVAGILASACVFSFVLVFKRHRQLPVDSVCGLPADASRAGMATVWHRSRCLCQTCQFWL